MIPGTKMLAVDADVIAPDGCEVRILAQTPRGSMARTRDDRTNPTAAASVQRFSRARHDRTNPATASSARACFASTAGLLLPTHGLRGALGTRSWLTANRQ